MQHVMQAAAEVLSAAAFDRGHRVGYLLGFQHAREARNTRLVFAGVGVFCVGMLVGALLVAL